MINRFPRSLFALSVAALGAVAGTRAAEPKYDMYLNINLGGQGTVMGGKIPVASGLYRATDREGQPGASNLREQPVAHFEHLGMNHIRMMSLSADPRDPTKHFYVSSLNGVQRTLDGGRTWRTMTSWNMTEGKDIAVDPNAPDHIYVGIPDGIAVSHDQGQTWQRMNEGIKRSYTESLVVDRTKAGRVLAGTELGIYLTEDGARTWKLVQPTTKVTYDLTQSPHDPKVFLAATSAEGLFRSDDGGRTWRHLDGVPAGHTMHSAVFDPRDANRLVACGWGAGVLVSDDGGRTWNDRTAGLPKREIWRVTVDPDVPGRLFAAPHLEPLFVSDDLGRTWRKYAFEHAIVWDMVFVPRK